MLSVMARTLATALLLTCVLWAGSARAEEPERRPDASPCACAAKKRCWGVVMMVYQKKVGLSKEEVEKGLPNRFFPATITFALRRPTEDGHFLTVECGSGRIPCTDKREELERRLIMSSFLGSLPLNLPEGTLYDPLTWRISERGEKAFAEVKSCRKGLLPELAAVALGPGGD
jgi:hypothetical protein